MVVVQQPKIQEDVNQCRWLDCTTVFDSAEALYDHITTVHIGRKSAGTLSLECKWAGCNSKASKRDHLTSHARVHINLKPHSCNICSKSFKRPQDLKKHEKIHTAEHHETHKQSKAVTVPPSTSGLAAPTSAPKTTLPKPIADKKQQQQQQKPQQVAPQQQPAPSPLPPQLNPLQQHQQPQQPQQQLPYNSPYYNLGFGFPMFGPGQGMPAVSTFDMATLVAQQQQLNAQASAGFPMTAMGMHGLPGVQSHPGFQFGMPANGSNSLSGSASQAHPLQNMYATTPMFQFGGMSYFGAPGQPGAPLQPSSAMPAPRQPDAPTLSLYPTLPSAFGAFTPSSAPNVGGLPTPSSLPSHGASPLPQYTQRQQQQQPQSSPFVKAEEMPSPAASTHSHRSHANTGYSSSVSPRVPALSPPSVSSPENTYSPPSDMDSHGSEEAYRRSISGNAMAGKKRGFEEAAGDFVSDLKNKRFLDEDAVAQIDNLASFYFSPDVHSNPLATMRPDDNSSRASISSDLSSSQDEVNKINELLLSLGQTLESTSNESLDAYAGLDLSHHSAPQQQTDFHHYPSLPSYGASLYPTLPSSAIDQPKHNYAPHFEHHEYARLPRSVAPPTISNDYKLPTFTTVGRLNKAPPPMSSYRDHVRSESMDEDHALYSKRATSSIRSTSMDEPAPAETTKEARVPLPPILAGLPYSHDAAVRLPPIVSGPSTSSHISGVTLPSIRSLIDGPDRSSSSSPMASSPSTSSSSAASSSSRTTIYPSFSPVTTSSASTADLSRPQSSGGTVERLAHRVHKLTMRHSDRDGLLLHGQDAASAPAPAALLEIESSDMSDSDDDNDNDHPSLSKKSRVESPEPMMSVDDEAELDPRRKRMEEQKARRLAVLRALVVMVNASYRQQVLAQRQQASKVEEKVEQEDESDNEVSQSTSPASSASTIEA